MDQQATSHKSDQLTIIGLIILNIVALSTALWLGLKDAGNRADTTRQTPETSEQQEDIMESTNTVTESGLGTFSVIFPDGWSDIIRDTESDFFWIGGESQPEIQLGKKPEFKEVKGFGTDSISVFSIHVGDNFSDARGSASDFTVGKDELKGKKYVYEYPADTEEYGMGYLRLKGDRDYTYVFDIGDGKQLQVWYHVFGVDPRNNVATVDSIVDSIRLKNRD